ncbi:MAG: hypothetical protein JW744_04975 [Candidatus Diapherotrites archaeon]|uniref:Uncharacterized protein n=1 Tax=Candidatus Iainarchaeum sp. TaxID=3101447 RepID=A0A938YRW0_9ARCH|nr:hypothetical protein [Candidatus Diapherotrites archaeon]
MLGKKLLIALIVLLFSANAASQFYLISNHTIEITLDEEGNAQVNERFFLDFQNEWQLSDFRDTVKEIGVSLDAWKEYDARLHPYIGQDNDISASKVSFIENSSNYLEISYSLTSSLMQKVKETSRVKEYSLKPKFFNNFLVGSLWVIPDDTTISINLPVGAELQPPVEPEAAINGSNVTWSGYKNSNKLTLNYRAFKQIASFDFGQAVRELMQSNLFWVVIVAAIVVCAILFWNRRNLGARVENYIVEHSDFSREEE